MLNFKQIEKLYSISLIHNPKHFYGNSFNIENIDGKLFLTGKARLSRNNRKDFKLVARLTPLSNPFSI